MGVGNFFLELVSHQGRRPDQPNEPLAPFHDPEVRPEAHVEGAVRAFHRQLDVDHIAVMVEGQLLLEAHGSIGAAIREGHVADRVALGEGREVPLHLVEHIRELSVLLRVAELD